MKSKLSLVAVGVALLIAGCGGGGGGGSSAPVANNPPPVVTPPVVVPPVVTPTSDLQTTVPAPTYAAGTQEYALFTTYNDFRAAMGLGKLKQDIKLDAADQNHLAYILANTDVDYSAVDPKTGRPLFHIEDAARPKFTGVTEKERATATGYTATYVGEVGSYGAGQGAANALNSLIATVYHRAGLMYQNPRDIGIAFGSDTKQTMVMTFGYSTTGQRNASDFVGSYPADKQTGVPLTSFLETPNPYPDITYADYSTKTSFPINIVVETNAALTVATFTVTEQGSTAPLDARLLTAANDPNKYLAGNTAFLVAKSAFKPNTTYTVNFTGAVDGKALVKAWSFTTAAQ